MDCAARQAVAVARARPSPVDPVRPARLDKVNDWPDSPITDASTYSIFVGARSNQDLTHADDAGIAWDTDPRYKP